MKRLMTIAFAAVFAGGAYAQVAPALSPDVYDYKASVKNPSLKSVKLKAACDSETVVTVKFITTTSLYGYLINECASCDMQSFGNGHGYLVAANTKDKIPTILPADLLAKIWPADGHCCVGSKTEM